MHHNLLHCGASVSSSSVLTICPSRPFHDIYTLSVIPHQFPSKNDGSKRVYTYGQHRRGEAVLDLIDLFPPSPKRTDGKV